MIAVQATSLQVADQVALHQDLEPDDRREPHLGAVRTFVAQDHLKPLRVEPVERTVAEPAGKRRGYSRGVRVAFPLELHTLHGRGRKLAPADSRQDFALDFDM